MPVGSYFVNSLCLVVLALAIEWTVGYPAALFTRIGHPVTWIGALIGGLDRGLNRDAWSFALRRLAGILALILIVLVPVAVAIALQDFAARFLPGWLVFGLSAVLGSSLVAQRSLREHVQAVATGLDTDLDAGRAAVAMIVGRDTRQLDEAGVARAAIESLAENTADGVVAPALWGVLFGLPGLVFYKAVNTADSMIGHRSDRHLAFGWAAARCDDLINLPWSRLTALLFAAAALTNGGSARDALRTAWRDAGNHQSPNAGWPEAALAGALGFALGGPRSYDGEMIMLPTMGSGRTALDRNDITRSLKLQGKAVWLMVAVMGVVLAGLALIR
jgi:adenosylcobinamide-phosphate synthase